MITLNDLLHFIRIVFYCLAIICFLLDFGYSFMGGGFIAEKNKTIFSFVIFCTIKVVPLVAIAIYSISKVYVQIKSIKKVKGNLLNDSFNTQLLWREVGDNLYIGSFGRNSKDIICIEEQRVNIFKYKVNFLFNGNISCPIYYAHTIIEAKNTAQKMINAHYQEVSNSTDFSKDFVTNELNEVLEDYFEH